ncbi:hypothetical protein BJ742DRAFT_864727 [Cladochytrium replicatum]|nr:hypothetical protein BJ742DRAFT_864727 [Cladochytrium replicatum]
MSLLLLVLVALASFPRGSHQQGCNAYVLQPQDGPQIIRSGSQLQLSFVGPSLSTSQNPSPGSFYVSSVNFVAVNNNANVMPAAQISPSINGNLLTLQVTTPSINPPQFVVVSANMIAPNGAKCPFYVTEPVVIGPGC